MTTFDSVLATNKINLRSAVDQVKLPWWQKRKARRQLADHYRSLLKQVESGEITDLHMLQSEDRARRLVCLGARGEFDTTAIPWLSVLDMIKKMLTALQSFDQWIPILKLIISVLAIFLI